MFILAFSVRHPGTFHAKQFYFRYVSPIATKKSFAIAENQRKRLVDPVDSVVSKTTILGTVRAWFRREAFTSAPQHSPRISGLERHETPF